MRVFAILDYNKDLITGTDEPLGVYPRGIRVDPEEANFADLSIDILSPLYEPIPDCPGGVDQISIDGEAILTSTYEEGDGDIAVILMKVEMSGPFILRLSPLNQTETVPLAIMCFTRAHMIPLFLFF